MILSDLKTIKDSIIVFGADVPGKEVLFFLKRFHTSLKTIYCFDNDENKDGTMLWGDVPCTKPYLIDSEFPIILTLRDEKNRKDVEAQCRSIGYRHFVGIDNKRLYEEINKLEDTAYLELFYYLRMNRELHLNNPETFNEKLQWLKVYDRNPLYHRLVDKYSVKEWVADRIGREHIIPTIGAWNDVDSIIFDELPRSFVIKCSHDSGSTVIVHDKYTTDMSRLKNGFETALATDYYQGGREWCYKDVPRRVICEPLIGDGAELVDYKIMCFNGRPKCLFVCTERRSVRGLHVTFYDMEWNELPFERMYPKSPYPIDKPAELGKMIKFAKTLSAGIPFVRVDFYVDNSRVLFGEMTFYPGSGVEPFSPEEWDYTLGEWLQLPDMSGRA